jgi:U4/U6 small nuclear ribonucleoprotein PRP4
MSDDIAKGIAAGNINVTSAPETLELTQASMATSERHQRALAELEKKKVARQIAVPTDDNKVKYQLRRLREPICLFGESIPDRRERLREMLAKKVNEGERYDLDEAEDVDHADEPVELFYTEGCEELKEARMKIAASSLTNSQKRIREAKRKRVQYEAVEEEDKQVGVLFQELKTLSSFASNIGDNRPISFLQFSPDSSQLATASWSGTCRVWDLPNCHATATLTGHEGRATSITWHPDACTDRDESLVSLVSSSSDNTARFWSKKGKELATLAGHTDRVNRAIFNPDGHYMATTSHDTTWRLWNVETRQELLRQDGHSRPVYGFGFQCDGSFACSSGLEGVVRVWDLRSGKSIHDLVGHVKQVLSVDVSANGYHIASGSDDRTAKIWDLRKMKCIYTIPAHSSLISTVRWQPGDGHYLATAAYDKTWKLWSTRDWSLIKTLPGHEGRVMCVDASRDGKYFASSSFDRTWKLWHKDD